MDASTRSAKLPMLFGLRKFAHNDFLGGKFKNSQRLLEIHKDAQVAKTLR